MKSVPTALTTALNEEHALKAIPEVIINWNLNRYVGTTVDNTPSDVSEGFEPDYFPISSITENNRPTKGINKARVNQMTIGSGYFDINTDNNGRYYIADDDDTYKYWTSPYPSDGTGAITKVKPQVIYDRNITVNKIKITTENCWASAKTFSIQVTTNSSPADTVDSSNWIEIANQSNVDSSWKASGVITLYWNGTSWTNTSRKDNADKTPITTIIRGLRIVVTALEGGYQISDTAIHSTYRKADASGNYIVYNTDGFNSYFDLIEIAAFLEVDISDYAITIEDDIDMSDVSNLYPIGTITTNQATITLSNLYKSGTSWVPGLFNANNDNSPYTFLAGTSNRYTLVEANAEINVRYKYYIPQDGEDIEQYLGTVQEFKMYVDGWTGQDTDTVSVQLSDYSKFFDNDEAKLRATMYENKTLPEIIFMILDSIGFSNYEIDYDPSISTEFTIPVFYTNGTDTIWQVLDALSKAGQCAIYFDGYGKLRVKTRDFAFTDDTSVWQFNSDDVGTTLASVVDATINTQFEPNYFKVTYQTTNWSKVVRGVPSLQPVWQPDTDTVVLRANPLVRDISDTTTSSLIWIDPKDILTWPYEGLVNIQGEIIRYSGKRYIYYTGAAGTTKNTQWITSQDEYNARNSNTPVEWQSKNHFDGAIKITERGVWNSNPRTHQVDINGWNTSNRILLNNTTSKTTTNGLFHDKAHSRLRLTSPAAFNDENDLLLTTRGAAIDSPFYNYGTRMRFLKDISRPQQRGGIVIHNANSKEDGYYFEITSSFLNASQLKNRNYFTLYSHNNGVWTVLDSAPAPIALNLDCEIDIQFKAVGSDHQLRTWINGQLVSDKTVTGSSKIASNGKFGMYVRGKSRAEFEYMYALQRPEEPDLPEDFSFLDKVQRGYFGYQWDREWVYRWKSKTIISKHSSATKQARVNRQFFDEFGPIVHEIRQFDVKFDPNPVLSTRLYLTNDWDACVLQYRANSFGAQFYIANTSRHNATIHGEDTLSFAGTGDSIQQVLNVFGRALVVSDAQEVDAQNDLQIKRRGKIASEITSTWLQNKEMAQSLADWLNSKFSYGNESISVQVFGNPLIEVGDVVTVTYADKYISGDWYVVGVKNSFDTGIVTNLELRQRV